MLHKPNLSLKADTLKGIFCILICFFIIILQCLLETLQKYILTACIYNYSKLVNIIGLSWKLIQDNQWRQWELPCMDVLQHQHI